MPPYKVTSVTVLQFLSEALLRQAQNRPVAFHPLHLPRAPLPLPVRPGPRLIPADRVPADLQGEDPLAVVAVVAVVAAGNSLRHKKCISFFKKLLEWIFL